MAEGPFGRDDSPMVAFPAGIWKIVLMSSPLRLTFVQSASRADQLPASPAEVALTKNVAADAAEWVSREAVQVLGGMGYMRETKVERLSRDARLLNIGGGTREIMNEIVGRALG